MCVCEVGVCVLMCVLVCVCSRVCVCVCVVGGEREPGEGQIYGATQFNADMRSCSVYGSMDG